MKRYSVVGIVMGNKYLGTFEAETGQRAIQMALEGGSFAVCLCEQCAAQCDSAEIVDVQVVEEVQNG